MKQQAEGIDSRGSLDPGARELVWVDFEPVGRRGEFPVGIPLLEAARRLGVGLGAVCGGQGTCGRCKVIVDGKVTPPSEAERSLFGREELAAGYRLACQTQALGNLKVSVPPESLTAPQRVQVEGSATPEDLDPIVVAYDLDLTPPSLQDLRSDWSRVSQALGRDGFPATCCDTMVLKTLPTFIREHGWSLRICQRGHEVIGLLPTRRPLLGVAFDLGTTTLAGYLLNLETGQTLATTGVMNPQIAYGEDVISRIGYAVRGSQESGALQKVLVKALAEMVDELTGKAGAAPSQVVEFVAVGNTTMHHLFLGLPVGQLGLAPYVPAISEPLDVKARDLGLPSAAGAYVHTLPNVAGFVGADHVAVLLATGLVSATQTTVVLDIGTNTEITLAHQERLLSCSCASGPAFEGAHLRDGMRAAPGAIERVRIAGERLEVQTIDDAPAVGICGSGALDAVAQFYLSGRLDSRGRFRSNDLPRTSKDGATYVLVPAALSGTGRDVVLTQRDVNEIMLAKAAIRAGIERLLLEVGVEPAAIDTLIIAGAFGTYISLDSAMVIGMFPPLPLSRCRQVGNAAGAGARWALVSKAQRNLAAQLARRVEYVELSGDPLFAQLFIEHLALATTPAK